MPKPRRAKPGKSIGLNLPAKSIGFFIIPISCPSACIHSEETLRPIHSTTSQQNEDFSIQSERDTTSASMNNLREITANEEDSNEKYYKKSEILKETRGGNRLALEMQDESKGEINKSNNSAEGDKTDESTISLEDDITNLIIERVKQRRKKVLEIEQKQKAADVKQLLTTASESSRQMTNQKQSSVKTKLSIEQTQMEDENQVEQSGDTDTREKREIISLEIPTMEMETQVRNIRKTSEEIISSAPLSLDPLSEYSCDCKRRGIACNCGLKLVSNLIQKIWADEPEIVKEKILNAVNLQKPILLTNMERNENPSNDLQDIKMLLQQYHTEMKNILTSLNSTNNALKNIGEKSDEIKINSAENMIPKYRMKRKLSADIINENSRSKHLRQSRNAAKTKWSRIKRQPMKFQDEENSSDPNPIIPECVREEFLKRHMKCQKHMKDQVESYHKKYADGLMAEINRNARSADITKNKLTSVSEVEVRKREILDSSSESVEDASDDNRTTKFNKKKDNVNKRNLLDSDDDKTKETDTYLNEISKEGKNLPIYLKHIQEDVYLVKPDINNEESINVLFKNNDKFSKQKNDKNDIITENNMSESKRTSITELTQNETSTLNLPDEEDDDGSNSIISSDDEFVDALDTTEAPSSLEDSNKGLVDNVFHTMFDVLNDFHQKIIEYLHYLSR